MQNFQVKSSQINFTLYDKYYLGKCVLFKQSKATNRHGYFELSRFYRLQFLIKIGRFQKRSS